MKKLTDLPGVGPKKAEQLRQAGIESVEDLLNARADQIKHIFGIYKIVETAKHMSNTSLVDEKEFNAIENDEVDQILTEHHSWYEKKVTIFYNGQKYEAVIYELLIDSRQILTCVCDWFAGSKQLSFYFTPQLLVAMNPNLPEFKLFMSRNQKQGLRKQLNALNIKEDIIDFTINEIALLQNFKRSNIF